MTNKKIPWEGLPDFTEDLRLWVNEPTLVRHVFDALDSVQVARADHRTEGARLPAGTPRVLLTILTYSYATTLYASDEIERRVKLDSQLRYLAAGTCPSADQLRRFRRGHRWWVQSSLAAVIHKTWESRISSDRREEHDGLKDVVIFTGRPPATEQLQFSPSTRSPHPWEIEAAFERAAQLRLNQAVLLDSMALDV